MTNVPQSRDISSPPAAAAEVPLRALGDTKVAYDVLRFVPEESAEHYKLVPLAVTDGVLEVGMGDPENLGGGDALNFIARNTGTPFQAFPISKEELERGMKMYR